MKLNCSHSLLKDTRGDVLMEYVLINLLVVLALVGVGGSLINPTGATFNVPGSIAGDDFGLFGNAVVASWRRVIAGLCLPIP